MNKKLQVTKYVLADIIAAIVAWGLFFTYRKAKVDPTIFHKLDIILNDFNLYKGLIIIPLFWIILYLMTGTYLKIYRKSRLKERELTLIIFFFIFLPFIFTYFLLFIHHSLTGFKDS